MPVANDASVTTLDARPDGAVIAPLRAILGADWPAGITFLDIGSGSVPFSLAARNLGAAVTSFDSDPLSVARAREPRRRSRVSGDVTRPVWRERFALTNLTTRRGTAGRVEYVSRRSSAPER